jgi:hypothetical protein
MTLKKEWFTSDKKATAPKPTPPAAPVEYLTPMMYPDEVAHLIHAVSTLSSTATILEYGTGGSTLLWESLLKPTQTLITIEHNEEWAKKIQDRITQPNVHVYHVPVQDMTAFGVPAEELPVHGEWYIRPVQVANWDDIELVFIDGVARAACLAACRVQCKPSTPVYLHDFKGRESWYQWAVNLYPQRLVVNTLLEVRVP